MVDRQKSSMLPQFFSENLQAPACGLGTGRGWVGGGPSAKIYFMCLDSWLTWAAPGGSQASLASPGWWGPQVSEVSVGSVPVPL